MEYPDDFNIPTFPAGPRIATSRFFGIATMVVFFLIVCMCVLVLWGQRSVRIHPFLISVDDITGQWEIVGHHHFDMHEVTTTQSLQESVLSKFLFFWFFVSADSEINQTIWSQDCVRQQDCNPKNRTGISERRCSFYCLTNDTVLSDFNHTVIPQYQAISATGSTWVLDASSVQLTPIGEILPDGGAWQIRATVTVSDSVPIDILAYAHISRDMELYPQTFGYYVSSFNAYKMNKQ